MPKLKSIQSRKTFIREWRKHRGLTLQGLADRLDMTPSHFSMLERGIRAYTQETLEKTAGALNTDVGSLLARDPLEPPQFTTIWEKAKPAQRKKITEMAKKIVEGK